MCLYIETFLEYRKLHAKVLPNIKYVLSGSNDNFVKDMVTLFQEMLPDSKLSLKLDHGSGKMFVVIDHDTLPCFKNILKRKSFI